MSTGKERLAALRDKARKRATEAPNYPDSPEQIEEQRQITEAMWPLQCETMAMLDTDEFEAGLAAWEENLGQ